MQRNDVMRKFICNRFQVIGHSRFNLFGKGWAYLLLASLLARVGHHSSWKIFYTRTFLKQETAIHLCKKPNKLKGVPYNIFVI